MERLVAVVQQDFKLVIGYSSVSHMGFVLLGLATLNQIGISGAIIQMFSHGILAGLLFATVGRLGLRPHSHPRTRQARPDEPQQGDPLRRAATFVIAGMAGMGLPGFSGFVAELMIRDRRMESLPDLRRSSSESVSSVGVVYIWRAIQKAFFAEPERHHHRNTSRCPPITLPERLGAIILICTSVAIGLYPQMLLKIITPALNSPLFDGVRKGGWQ